MFHALVHPLRTFEGRDEVHMVIGPARDGRVLEEGIVDDDPRVIHAMTARPKFWP